MPLLAQVFPAFLDFNNEAKGFTSEGLRAYRSMKLNNIQDWCTDKALDGAMP